jgi:hypothetical protein
LFHQLADDGAAMGLSRRAAVWSERAAELDRVDDVLVRPPAEQGGSLVRKPDHWIVALDGREAVVAHRVGMTYLARLLGAPDTDITALDLVAWDAGPASERPSAGRQSLLDDRAVATYRRRVHELGEELEDARACNDIERAARAQLELDAIIDELESAHGLGGRARCFSTDGERARTSVHKAIKRAIERVVEVHPTAGAVLRDGVVTGSTCRYSGAVPWDVS